jgi:hypothetical protein
MIHVDPSACNIDMWDDRSGEEPVDFFHPLKKENAIQYAYVKTNTQRVEEVNVMERFKCISGMDFMKDWDTWRSTLKEAIGEARKMGVSDAVIQDLAVKIGDFLAEKVCPATKEEELLKEMWDAGTPEERKTIATLMFKMVK